MLSPALRVMGGDDATPYSEVIGATGFALVLD
jgi:hypothetical protein